MKNYKPDLIDHWYILELVECAFADNEELIGQYLREHCPYCDGHLHTPDASSAGSAASLRVHVRGERVQFHQGWMYRFVEAPNHPMRCECLNWARVPGYGRCPVCGESDHPSTSRERRPNGDTCCGHCGKKSPSLSWERNEVGAEPPLNHHPNCEHCKR